MRSVEEARGDALPAVDVRKGLISGRWTLLERFQSGGRRYLLARAIDGAGAMLTLREEQALAYAALGYSNKVIGFEMGISASTVGVLLHRAARKLDAGSREELLRNWRERRSMTTGHHPEKEQASPR